LNFAHTISGLTLRPLAENELRGKPQSAPAMTRLAADQPGQPDASLRWTNFGLGPEADKLDGDQHQKEVASPQ